MTVATPAPFPVKAPALEIGAKASAKPPERAAPAFAAHKAFGKHPGPSAHHVHFVIMVTV